MIRRLTVLALALLGCAEAWTKGGGAKALTGAQFDEQVTKGRGFWMVAFYAPWCGHCQMLEPEWEKAGKKLKGRAQLGSMDCQQGDAEAVCGRFDIKGFPTILVFGKERAKGEPYNGERTADAIAAFAGEAAKGFAPASMIEALSYKGVHAFLHGGSAPGRLLYLAAPAEEEGEEEGAAPAWLDALSNSYSSGGRRSVAMGFVPAADVAVAKRFKLKATALPALVFCHHAAQRWEALKAGKLKAKAAAKFVAAAFKRAQGAADDAVLAALPRLPVFPAPKVPRKKARKSLRELTAENAKKRCFGLKGKKNVCVIMLLEPDAPGLEDDDAALLGGLADKYRNDPFVSFLRGRPRIASPPLHSSLCFTAQTPFACPPPRPSCGRRRARKRTRCARTSRCPPRRRTCSCSRAASARASPCTRARWTVRAPRTSWTRSLAAACSSQG